MSMKKRTSTIQPFKPGDVLVGATVLNNDEDDHAGEGRIIQYDSELNEKGVLWTSDTTHLVGGLRFGPDGNLWAFDSQAHKVLRITPKGEQLPEIDFGARAFSNINFTSDGNLLMGEHLVGDTVKLPPGRPLGTTLPFIPGTERFGDGHVFRFSAKGEMLHEYATETHGGMAAFLGVTSSSLAPDGKTLVYLSEISPRVCRYDIEADLQLPDLITFTPESGDLAVNISHRPDGTMLFIKAHFEKGFCLQTLDREGGVVREYPLQGAGWAALCTSLDHQAVFIGNFFTGQLIKLDLNSGEVLASADTGVQRSLAGIAQFPG